MFEIRRIATTGFDRAIIAMRRDNGGREASDSYWTPVDDEQYCTFAIGEKDIEECNRLIQCGSAEFLKYIGVWAYIDAPISWWGVYGGYFIAQSDVRKDGYSATRSVFTTYYHLRNLAETFVEAGNDWSMVIELFKALEDLPESWMIIPEIGKMEA